MKERLVKTYTCDFCKKIYFRKGACEKHEKFCYKNPTNEIACFQGCLHLQETTIEVDTDYQGTRTAKVFYCNKFEKVMYTLGAERRGLDERFKSLDQIPMPKIECEFYEDWLK